MTNRHFRHDDSDAAFCRRLSRVVLLAEQLPNDVLKTVLSDDRPVVSGGRDWDPDEHYTVSQRPVAANRR
jgi:hypothetical protein